MNCCPSSNKDPRPNCERVHPYATTNILGKWFHCYMIPFLQLGYNKLLTDEDYYQPLPEDRAACLGQAVTRSWEAQLIRCTVTGERPRLWKSVIKIFLKRLLFCLITLLIEEWSRLLCPVLLFYLLQYFEVGSVVTQFDAYMLAMALASCTLLQTLTHHPYFYNAWHMGMQMRIACSTLIYDKSLKISQKSLGETTTGQIINLLSNDVNRFDVTGALACYSIVGPVCTVIVLLILINDFGLAGFCGVFVIVLGAPAQLIIGKILAKIRTKSAELTDIRIRYMNEVVTGIRIIKMYAWELPFFQLIRKARLAEMMYITRFNRIKLTNNAIMTCLTMVAAYIMFAIHTFMGYRLEPASAFKALGLISALKSNSCSNFSASIHLLSECYVTLCRIERFLLLDEQTELHPPVTDSNGGRCDVMSDSVETETCKLIHNGCHEPCQPPPPPGEKCVTPHVETVAINANWNDDIDQLTLSNINLRVDTHQLLAIIGPVGCGKSSLLMTLLSELPLSAGSISIQGSIAYVPQVPWIFTGTVRDNILLGKPYNKQWFDRVIDACALTHDLSNLTGGELSLVGERGVFISGGQKARICLARAVYQNADVYLLDDPLSAVDIKVGKEIFKKCLCGLLKDKPRILVTHQVQHLVSADHIIILNEGLQAGCGSFNDLRNSGIDFAKLLKSHDEKSPTSSRKQPPSKTAPLVKRSKSLSGDNWVSKETGSNESLVPRMALVERRRTQSHVDVNINDPEMLRVRADSGMSLAEYNDDYIITEVKQLQPEEQNVGVVQMSTYIKYLRSGGNPVAIVMALLVYIVSIALMLLCGWWLAEWVDYESYYQRMIRSDDSSFMFGINNYTTTTTTTQSSVEDKTESYLMIYTLIVILMLVTSYFRTSLVISITSKSSQNLHARMFSSIVRSPVKFFDDNPSGRVLNRFSKDMGFVDDLLPEVIRSNMSIGILCFEVVILVIIICPYVILAVIPLTFVFYWIRVIFIRSSRQIRRSEAVRRSPLYTHLSATLQGLITIRGFSVSSLFKKEFYRLMDDHSSLWILNVTSQRWLGVVIDGLCTLFVTIVTFSLVALSEDFGPGLAGLALMNTVILQGNFQYFVRLTAELEGYMTSTERVLSYTDLPAEGDLEKATNRPADSWPRHGEITLSNIHLRYADDQPIVLKNINIHIKPREKIGIVGRTGSGKTSLLSCLLRLVEPTGVIDIDGVNVLNIGLHSLRKKISSIPQDPVLFSGTLRHNLDPFQQYSDLVLWNALREVNLKSVVEELPLGLDSQVTEYGQNFSVGQRQLVCLARAILKQNRILIMDEATANVDPRTDAAIQRTVRQKFKYCTVLTIAHRLHTVMDSDRILVLNNGEVIEFDQPYNLLRNRNSTLSSLVREMGTGQADDLHTMAERTYRHQCHLASVESLSDIGLGLSREVISEECAPQTHTNHINIPSSGNTSARVTDNHDEQSDIPRREPGKDFLWLDSHDVEESVV